MGTKKGQVRKTARRAYTKRGAGRRIMFMRSLGWDDKEIFDFIKRKR
mgnify:CR=1 FL=1